jgi:hypothetical protein
MAMYYRVGFTAAQSAELWERWKKGEGLKSIGERTLGVRRQVRPSACARPDRESKLARSRR